MHMGIRQPRGDQKPLRIYDLCIGRKAFLLRSRLFSLGLRWQKYLFDPALFNQKVCRVHPVLLRINQYTAFYIKNVILHYFSPHFCFYNASIS